MGKDKRENASGPWTFAEWLKVRSSFRDRTEEELREDYAKLLVLYENKDSKDVQWWRDFGSRIEELVPKGWRKHYRTHDVMQSLCNELLGDGCREDVPLLPVLYLARRFAVAYDDSDIKWLKREKNSHSHLLSPQHLFCVLPLPNKEQRQSLLKQCLTRSWTVERLRSEVRDRKKYPKYPRKPRPLPRLIHDSERVSRRYAEDLKAKREAIELVLGDAKTRIRHLDKKVQGRIMNDIKDLRESLSRTKKQVEQWRKLLEGLKRQMT